METRAIDKVVRIAARKGLLRPIDLDEFHVPRRYADLLYKRGILERVGRGLYVLKDAQPSEHRSLAEVARRVPHGVVCLLSALRFHHLTTQNPFEVWMAIDRKARPPREPQLAIRFVRFSGEALSFGVEKHRIEGVQVKVYSPSKSVADSFKYRNKIGLDVALEALKDSLHNKKATPDELLRAARVCRVEKVMKPYVEALV